LFHQLVFKCFLEGPRVCRVHRCRDHPHEHPDLRGREGRLVPDRQEEQDDREGLPPHQGRVYLASECRFSDVGIKQNRSKLCYSFWQCFCIQKFSICFHTLWIHSFCRENPHNAIFKNRFDKPLNQHCRNQIYLS